MIYNEIDKQAIETQQDKNEYLLIAITHEHILDVPYLVSLSLRAPEHYPRFIKASKIAIRAKTP